MGHLQETTDHAHGEALIGLASCVDDIGSRRLATLMDELDSPVAAWRADLSTLERLGWPASAIQRFAHRRATTDRTALLQSLSPDHITVIPRTDPRYPPLLLQIPDPPIALFARGSVEALHTPSLAIVGTRACTPYGAAATRLLVPPLVSARLSITSGLAYGIDAEAHRTALAAHGCTVAVLGTGVDDPSIYPRAHQRLAHEIIANGGAVVSEYVPGTSGVPLHFPARNRIIAGLTLGTIVVEAPEDSGALITAQFALDFGREVFAVPGPITEPIAAGSNRLIAAGAQPATRVNDIFDALGLTRTNPSAAARASRAGLEGRILETLSAAAPTHVDDLGTTLAAAAAELAHALTTLELDGAIRDVGGGRYIKNP